MQEKHTHSNIKHGLFIGLMVLLFLPMLQHLTQVVDVKPLKGSFKKVERPVFTYQNWFNDEYQAQQQAFLNQHIGFRSFFVRLYNQWHYSLYKEARAKSVVIGKQQFLYEENYIQAHLGRDFIGEDAIKKKVTRLAYINDQFAKKGIQLIVLLAPGKGSFYPEYIPEHYQPELKTTTNYEVYQRELSTTTIHLLDFHQWFRSMKETAPYPLFPKTGIHWSRYGELLAADSLFRYINSIISHKKTPDMVFGDLTRSTSMKFTDDDIEKGMNLLFNIADLPMAYPQFELKTTSSLEQPKILTVADSYYWGMFNSGFSRDAFHDGSFWYYHKRIFPISYTTPTDVSDINIIEALEENDVVVLLSTDANLYKFAFGFIDQVYEAYATMDQLPANKHSDEARLQFYIQLIKNDAKWLASIQQKAEKKQLPIEEAIRKNAQYMVWKEKQR